jgi:hypothetical protein
VKSGPALPFSVAPLLAFVFVCGVASLASAFPLTGSPGPEAAQLLSILGGPALFLAAIARGARRADGGFRFDLALQGGLVAIAFTVMVVVVTIAGWSRPSCAPGRGYLPFFLQSLPVLLLSSTLGLFIGRLVGHVRWAVGIGFVAYLLYLGWLGLDWTLEPSFRVVSHLSLLVEGDLVRGRALSAGAVAFRMATLLFAIAVAFFGQARFPAVRRSGLSAGPQPGPGYWIAGLVLLLIGGVVHYQAKDELLPEREAMEAAYSLSRQRGRLVVHADPGEVDVRYADAILAEGTLWLERLKDRMDVEPSEDIHIWLHRDERAMAHWTGAEHVHFALPGRRELHVSRAQVPHPTLGHELVHILGGEIAGGLFGVPTHWVFLPDAGIVEGLAMAISPELEAPRGLTLREKAAAMRRAKVAPPLKDLFSGGFSFFGFWRHPPSNAYATAGALIEAIAAARGVEALQAIYREGDLEAGFGSGDELDKFVAEHEAALDKMPLPAFAIPFVSQRYSRPSILDETCDPEAVEAALRVRRAAGARDFDTAERVAKEAEGELAPATLLGLARTAEALEDGARALRYLSLRADATKEARDHVDALHDLGDRLWRAGQRREAMATWGRIETENLAPWELRLVTAKRALSEAIRARPDAATTAEGGLELLLAAELNEDMGAALAQLGAVVSEAKRDDPVEPLVRYLLARQLVRRGEVDDGLLHALDAWQRRDRLTPEFVLELESIIALAHARRGDVAIAAAGFEALAARASTSAQRVQLRDRQARALRMLTNKDAPAGDLLEGDRSLLGIERGDPW